MSRRVVQLGAVVAAAALALCGLLWLLTDKQVQAQETGTYPPPSSSIVVQFIATSYTVNETDGFVELTVALNQPSQSVVTVDFTTVDGIATGTSSPDSPGDYESASGTIQFAPGQTTQVIRVTIVDDLCVEPTEDFQVQLSNAQGATLGADSSATIYILDND